MTSLPVGGLAHALVTQEPQLAGGGGVRGDGHAALDRRHVLGGVEAEHGRGPESAGGPAVQCRAVGLGSVFDDRQAVAGGEREQRAHRGGVPVQVHRDDRRGARRDCGGDRGGVEAEGDGVDVGEHRGRAGQGDGSCGRGEGERRDDHLITRADAQRQQGQVQRRGPGADGDAVPAVHEGGELVLERGDLRPLCDLAGAQDRDCGGDFLLAQQRARDGDHRRLR
jgi:hypothetical protein